MYLQKEREKESDRESQPEKKYINILDKISLTDKYAPVIVENWLYYPFSPQNNLQFFFKF